MSFLGKRGPRATPIINARESKDNDRDESSPTGRSVRPAFTTSAREATRPSGPHFITLGNLRSTTKETTTTSIDRARTGTRKSFSVGEMKVKKRSACTTTTT